MSPSSEETNQHQGSDTIEEPQKEISPVSGHSLRILLADDGSEHARAAVELLRNLPLPSDTTVYAMAVVPTIDITKHNLLESALKRSAEQLKESGVNVVIEIKSGVPAATINDFAERHNPDLIIMGAKGLRATLGILLGGVVQQVVEYSCCPVLVVRAPYTGIKRVLVVTDGSIYSQCALAYIGAQIDKTDAMGTLNEVHLPLPASAEITIMHVLPPLITSEMMARSWTVGPDMLVPLPVEPIDEKKLQEEEERQGQAILDQALAAMKSGGKDASSVLRRGDAATEIIEYIKDNQVDLVVCGSRGLSQVTGWLLGSVSRKLVHYAGCSVLIVKRDKNGKDRR